ncbi:MAG TPA: LysR family transcriptional regulator [Herbaspirillum sp.]|jgi:DNA-binding transcriptional LysR family regulator
MKSKRNPSWDDLRIFLELSRHPSLHAASKKLGVDHATVCRHLARVEAAFGLKLVDRKKSGVHVRPEAMELLKHIEHMELHARLLLQSAGALNEGLQLVRIATMEGFASGFIAPRTPLLHSLHPNIKIELVATQMTMDVSKREADIFLGFFKPQSKMLRSKKIGEFSLHLYCSDAYIERKGLPASHDELPDHDYVGYIKDLMEIDAVAWLEDLVPSPRLLFHSNSVIAQRAAAIAGLGIVMLPTFVTAGVEQLKPILPEQFVVKREVWMSVGADPEFLSPVRTVMTFLEDQFEALSFGD